MEVEDASKSELEEMKRQLRKVTSDVERLKREMSLSERETSLTWENSGKVIADRIMSTVKAYVRELGTDVVFLISTFDKGGSIHVSGRRSNELGESDLVVAGKLLAPLSNIERLKILLTLYQQDRYTSELASVVNVASGTLHYHLKELQSIGFISQERNRGKYLITWTGSVAVELVGLLVGEYKDGGRTKPLLRKREPTGS